MYTNMRASDKWKTVARAEGRICPECKSPISKEQWKRMQTKKGVDVCWICKSIHWNIPIGAGGNVFDDNADREVFSDLRVDDL